MVKILSPVFQLFFRIIYFCYSIFQFLNNVCLFSEYPFFMLLVFVLWQYYLLGLFEDINYSPFHDFLCIYR